MKSILVQQSSEKFIQNCSALSFEDIMIIDISIGNNLYQTFFRHKPEYCIFSGSLVNKEILQFCEDYSDSSNIYFFHIDSKSHENIKSLLPPECKVIHIGYDDSYDAAIPLGLVNDQLFYSTNDNKKDGIVCFMDGLASIPNELLDLLYPSSSAPIKLFNCPSIRHYQNLGMLTEQNRANLLQKHKYYLDLKQDAGFSYTNEAKSCGAIIVSLEQIKDNSYTSNLPVNTNHTNITYNKFLRELFKL
jgi:hypothetical protein